ncbi:hypothetical protein HDV00_008625 [Rhizophlyctis rosea]|nr:hypothetical protein HDV00_008625 [Rhizophlyctis rosea]
MATHSTTAMHPEPTEVLRALKSTGLFDALRETLLEDYKESTLGSSTHKRLETVLESHKHYVEHNPVLSATISRKAAALVSGSHPVSEGAAVQAEFQKVRQVLDKAVASSKVLTDFSTSVKSGAFLRSDGPFSRMEEAIQAIFDQNSGKIDAPQEVLQKIASSRREANVEITTSISQQHVEETQHLVSPPSAPPQPQPAPTIPAHDTPLPTVQKSNSNSDAIEKEAARDAEAVAMPEETVSEPNDTEPATGAHFETSATSTAETPTEPPSADNASAESKSSPVHATPITSAELSEHPDDANTLGDSVGKEKEKDFTAGRKGEEDHVVSNASSPLLEREDVKPSIPFKGRNVEDERSQKLASSIREGDLHRVSITEDGERDRDKTPIRSKKEKEKEKEKGKEKGKVKKKGGEKEGRIHKVKDEPQTPSERRVSKAPHAEKDKEKDRPKAHSASVRRPEMEIEYPDLNSFEAGMEFDREIAEVEARMAAAGGTGGRRSSVSSDERGGADAAEGKEHRKSGNDGSSKRRRQSGVSEDEEDEAGEERRAKKAKIGGQRRESVGTKKGGGGDEGRESKGKTPTSSKKRPLHSDSESESEEEREKKKRPKLSSSSSLQKDKERKASFGSTLHGGKERGGDEGGDEGQQRFKVGMKVAAFVTVPRTEESESDSDDVAKEKETCYIVVVDGFDSKTKLYRVRDPDPDEDEQMPDRWKVPGHKIVDYRRKEKRRALSVGDAVYALYRETPEDEPLTEFYKGKVVRSGEKTVIVRYNSGEERKVRTDELFSVFEIPPLPSSKPFTSPNSSVSTTRMPAKRGDSQTKSRRSSMSDGEERRGAGGAVSRDSSPLSDLSTFSDEEEGK